MTYPSHPLSRTHVWCAARSLMMAVCLLPTPVVAEESAHDDALTRASQALHSGNYDGARDVLQDALESDRENAHLIYNIGVTYYAQGRLGEAERRFLEADLKTDDNRLRARLLAQLGNIETHRSRQSVADGEPEAATDSLRRALQFYNAAVLRDPGQRMATANRERVGGALVTAIVSQSKSQVAAARVMRRQLTRVEILGKTRAQLEEALVIDPDHAEARALADEVDELLVENLTGMGLEKLQIAKQELEQDGRLNRALAEATAAEGLLRDAASIDPDSETLDEHLEAAAQVASEVLTELGRQKLDEAHGDLQARQQVQRLEAARGHLEQALQRNPENTEAKSLRDQATEALVDALTRSGDESVAVAERRPDAANHVAVQRARANEAYSAAAELRPDDPTIQQKQRDNALELAQALAETGNEELAKGRELLPENPDAAVGRLEAAIDDFTTAGELLAQHEASAEQARAAMDAAAGLLAEQTPGDSSAGSASAQQQPGQPDAGEGSSGGPSGSEALSAEGMQQKAEESLGLLQDARAALAGPTEQNTADAGGEGKPSYESIAYVTGGSAFDNEEGGGSNEREGNFETEAMNRPQRDW